MAKIGIESVFEMNEAYYNMRTMPTMIQSPNFSKDYHFMFHFMSSLVTWDVVILVLIILKTHVWLRDIYCEILHFESNIL